MRSLPPPPNNTFNRHLFHLSIQNFARRHSNDKSTVTGAATYAKQFAVKENNGKAKRTQKAKNVISWIHVGVIAVLPTQTAKQETDNQQTARSVWPCNYCQAYVAGYRLRQK